MKRFRIGEDGEMDNINMANVLMLLSRSAGGGDQHVDHHRAGVQPGRVFECKTCSRQFPSFQALGGHRASHKKPRVVGDGAQAHGALAKPRVHECSVCGLEFAIGQALGGHMRRHRTTADGFGHGVVEKKAEGKRSPALWLDLNLPPSDDETDCTNLVFGMKLVDKTTPMVDCFQ